ncbi:MAG: hypothetical protein KTQ13_03595 [Ferruginibacter sp.]|nr:hypothetical protein [Ferruginibacter sp.]MBU9935710.1 hypothetical protein [Ferruginibacter sp.]
MKARFFISILLLTIAVAAAGQPYKYIYYMDANLNFAEKGKANVIGKAYEKDGHLVLDCFAKTTEQKFLSATFKDSTLGELDGLFRTFHINTVLESEGSYINNEMNGVWRYWDNRGFLTDSVIYSQGIRVAYAKYDYYFGRFTLGQYFGTDNMKNALHLLRYSFTDSLNNTFSEKEISFIDGKPRLNFEADFIGNRGVLKDYDSTGAFKTDSVFDRILKEASFPGGDDEWRYFLFKNLNSSVPADSNAPDGKYTVIIKFIVDTDGTLYDIIAENDPGYGTAKEALRVIQKSPKWKPAIKYGRYFRAYRRQPITFFIESGGR